MSRNKTYGLTIILSLVISLFSVNSAHAIYKGEDVSESILVASSNAGCSPAPIAPRILVLAQHCYVNVGQTYVNYPGKDQGGNGYAKVIAQFSPDKDYIYNRENDISVIVVDKDIPVDKNLQIASESDIKRFILNDSTVYFYGYGQIGKDLSTKTPYRASFKFVKNPPQYMIGHPGYTEFYATNGVSEVCSGDSGGPSYVFEGDKIFYLGTTVSSNKPFCSANTGDISLARNTLMYYHMGLIEKANDWLLKNPIKSDILVESSKPVETKETATAVIAPTPTVTTAPQSSITTVKKPVVKKVIVKKKAIKKKK